MKLGLKAKIQIRDIPVPPHYSADITAGSLLIHESKKTASLLLTGLSPAEVKKKVVEENLFQKRSPKTSARQ
ncbi:MAG: BrxA family protein, partial [Desulfomonile sp.]